MNCNAQFNPAVESFRNSLASTGVVSSGGADCFGVDMESSNKRIAKLGENNPRWKGGLSYLRSGRVKVYSPAHPCANKNYVLRSHLVVEKHLGRYLVNGEVVHHLNHDCTDDRIENLQVMSWSEHSRLHRPKINRWSINHAACIKCNSTRLKHRAHGLCRYCYKKSKRLI